MNTHPLYHRIALAAFAISLPSVLSPAAIGQTADSTAPGDVVQMEAFNVSTAIGAYHEETSSMATKVPTNLKELASSLQILNASAISDRNAISLQDVYSYIVGMTQSQYNANGFTFRGFTNTGSFTQNIEYDGLQGGASAHGAVSAANVESLEFLKGPNSVLYGQMKPGGLMNIVTKSPQPIAQTTVKTSLSTYFGSYDSFGVHNGIVADIDTTGPIDQARHWLYRFIADGVDSRLARKGDYDIELHLYPSLTYKWSNDTFFTIKGEYIQEKKRFDSGLLPIFTNGIAYGRAAQWFTAPQYTVYQDPTDTGRDRGAVVATSFQTRFADNWTVRVQTRSTWHTDIAHDLETNNVSIFVPTASFATPTTTLKRQYNSNVNGHRYNYFDANAYGVVGPENFKNTILFGVGGGVEFVNNQRFAFGPNVSPAITLINPILGQSPYPADGTKPQSPVSWLDNLGEYVSDQMKIGSRLHLTLGTRHDQQSAHGLADKFQGPSTRYLHQFVEAYVSQAGVVFDVTDLLSWYGAWSQSLVPNQITQLDLNGNAFAPERGEQVETGLKFDNAAHTLYASLAAYRINRSNVAVTTNTTSPTTGQAIFRVDGLQRSEGFEFETQWHPVPYWQIQVSATLCKAFVAQSSLSPKSIDTDLANAPRTAGSFWSRYNVPGGTLKGLGVGLGVVYTGRQWGGDPTSAVGPYFSEPGWTRVDGALYYKWKRYDMSLNVQNALDRKYILSIQTATLLIPSDARKVTYSVTTHF